MAVGGGSSIDTAKAVNLLTTNPGELLDYVNAPVGKARAPQHALKPLVAVPTTTGTGSESTTICVLDVLAQHVKTGISHPRLRPTLAVVDPLLTMSQPAGVTAAAGMDILCHALESWTARPFSSYDRKKPEERVPYCGANPVADMWAEKAMSLLAVVVPTGGHARRRRGGARADGARGDLRRHGVRQRGRAHPARQRLPDRGAGQGLPADRLPRRRADGAARDGGVADGAGGLPLHLRRRPERHVRAAAGAGPGCERAADDRDLLPDVLRTLMRDIEIPNGLGAVGYDEGDVGDLVEGAVKQQRLLATAPKDVTEDDLAAILTGSLELW